MKKLIIVNEVCSDNIGDHAINLGVLKILDEYNWEGESYGFDAEKKNVERTIKKTKKESNFILILKFIKNKTLKNNRIYKYSLWVFRNCIRVLNITKQNKGQAIIIGGGQLIQSGGTFAIAMYIWTLFSKLRNIDIYIIGVGCAEHFDRIDRFLFKRSLSRAKDILVREKSSVSKMKDFFDCDVRYIPDLAYALFKKDDFDHKKDNLAIIGCTAYYVYMKNINELGLKDIMTFEQYINTWVSIILDECNEHRVLLLSTTVEDAEFSRVVYNQISKNYAHLSGCIIIKDEVLPVREYIELLKTAKIVRSGRMHSLILGHISGCKCIPYYINKKIEHFSHEYLGHDASNISQSVYNSFGNAFYNDKGGE
ncbi:polysaccharide pyruvyl transferase family protein [Escherichia coli]|uniref:polysaccharide pyruvyl transferase family protein n=1 Tax=Escherichia coli TaxID=562 RepID=UPI001B8DBAAF|nr:polysaccharide pyruvyl transferase family protein [Escherichia coli]HBC8326735.1 polysaccharide pyruvyl transferase family protein [Escherichia coli]HDX9864087.1 polysaccharide pyruvyl transferase family protein [Escherichia coli]